MDTTWIWAAAMGATVAIIKWLIVDHKSEQQGQANETQKDLFGQKLEVLVSSNSGHVDLSLVRSCAALALDRTTGMLYVSQNVGMEGVSIPLGELEEVRLEDHSEDYRHALEMESCYSGNYSNVHGTSMYRPHDGHKWTEKSAEIKQGHTEFKAYKGKTIYGIEIKRRGGDIIQVPLYLGDGTLLWTEEENRVKAREFVHALEAAIVEAKAGNPEADSEASQEAQEQLKVYDTVTFGHYEQDGDAYKGSEAIEWIVLDIQDGCATLISKYGLDAKPYNDECTEVTWETCTLRQWLNGDFLNSAFTVEEQDKLKGVTVRADANPEFDTNSGNDTQDKVFLLSIGEANRYFASDSNRLCIPTRTAVTNGVYTNKAGVCWWWLRTPGYRTYGSTYVFAGGSVNSNGNDVNNGLGAVRPVVVLRLS